MYICVRKYVYFRVFLFQPRPTKGKMRIHCLENVDKALQFLREQRVHLENMGSHDIVDGNPRLSLGLIWTIILRFQVPKSKNLLLIKLYRSPMFYSKISFYSIRFR